jgi:hypothetical protein
MCVMVINNLYFNVIAFNMPYNYKIRKTVYFLSHLAHQKESNG